jgi:Holliday junction resolvasome RuvABC endonuclease subunit
MKIVGLDLSLNHAGATLLDARGAFLECAYFTNAAGSAKKAAYPIASRLNLPKTEERQMMQMQRLAWVKHWLETVVLDRWKPTHVGIEDYALRVEHGAHYMGEIGGIARMLCWERGVYFRLHDPITVKMATTHDGTAQKDLVEEFVKKRWGLDFTKYNADAPKGKNMNRATSEDLADSAAIAKLVWTEIQLRSGKLAASVLHPKEIQAFNRITKTYPVSLLGREWIRNPDGSYNSAEDVVKRVREKARFLKKMCPGTVTEKFVTGLLEGTK